MHTRPRAFSPGLLLLLVVFAGFVTAFFSLTRSAAATEPVTWGRSYANAQGDTISVPAKWPPACDALGCADAYRVTWSELVPRTGGQSPVENILLERLVETPADVGRYTAPAIGVVKTVCLQIVSIRRGLPSESMRGCRTIETPDAPPPPVDSIVWDSLGVSTSAALERDSINPTGAAFVFGAYRFRNVLDTATRRLRTDSALLTRTFGRPPSATFAAGEYVQVCMTAPHRYRFGTTFILFPRQTGYTRAQVTQYLDRCRQALQSLQIGTVRVALADVAFAMRAPVPPPQDA